MTDTLPLPIRTHVRKLVGRLAASSSEAQVTDAIFAFYRRMRDDKTDPEEFLREHPKEAHSLGVVYLFHAALESNRDAGFLGQVFHGYELKYRLGRGGMGHVYFADGRPSSHPESQAIKVVPFDAASLPDHNATERARRRGRAFQEAEMLGRVNDHGHVVRFYGAGEDVQTESVFIRLEHIDGVTLEDLVGCVTPGPLPAAEAIALIIQASRGLEAMHEAEVIHRDVKPSNLMVDAAGRVKVTDLGLAGTTSPGKGGRLTRTGEGAGGTPGYVAWEQFFGGAAGPASDVYSLGWTLFDLIFPPPPSPATWDPSGKFRFAPATTDVLWQGFPPGLADVVVRATAKNPGERFQTMPELREALSRLVPATNLTETMRRFAEIRAGEDHLVNIWVGEDLARRKGRPTPPARRLALLAVTVGAVTLIGALTAYFGGKAAQPTPDQASAELPADGKVLKIVQLNVSHAERVGDAAVEKGLLGVGSFSAKVGDRAKVAVLLSRPAYGYLIAYAADGREFLLDPPDETKPPASSEKLLYPPVGQRVEYEFSDGEGMHVFLAAVGSEPLPAYAEWKKNQGAVPWGKAAGRPGVVWRLVGGHLHGATAADPDVRGPGAAELGVGPVEKLADWWRKQPGISQVGLTGFTVTKAE